MGKESGLLHNIWGSILKSSKLLFFSIGVLVVLIVLCYIILRYADENKSEKFIMIFGFCATIYSVFLTILLYRFISISETAFYLASNDFVENNKNEIIKNAIYISNFVKDTVNIIYSGTENPSIAIPVEFRSSIKYITSLNKSHVNEHTNLYKCKDSFYEFEKIINEINFSEVKDMSEVDKKKIDELWNISSHLLLSLNTIFKRGE